MRPKPGLQMSSAARAAPLHDGPASAIAALLLYLCQLHHLSLAHCALPVCRSYYAKQLGFQSWRLFAADLMLAGQQADMCATTRFYSASFVWLHWLQSLRQECSWLALGTARKRLAAVEVCAAANVSGQCQSYDTHFSVDCIPPLARESLYACVGGCAHATLRELETIRYCMQHLVAGVQTAAHKAHW